MRSGSSRHESTRELVDYFAHRMQVGLLCFRANRARCV